MTIAELPIRDASFEAALLPVMVGAFAVSAAIALVARLTNRKSSLHLSRRLVSWLVYLGFAVSVVVLAVTAFLSIVDHGHMRGYALMAHTAAAGGFVFLLLAVAIVFLPHFGPCSGNETRWWLSRATSWLLVISGLAVSATMFASMLPLLGTQDLIEAIRWHRWAGLTCVVALVLHVTAIVCVRMRWR